MFGLFVVENEYFKDSEIIAMENQMKTIKVGKTIAVAGIFVVAFFSAASNLLADGNIDNADKYAWAENAGWQNWNSLHGGVTVMLNGNNGYLEGYVWAENIGFIKVGAGGGPYGNTAADDYGVNVDASWKLSGYGWSEVAGWINFNPTHSQVVIDKSTGSFEGYAWGENIGWINFKNSSPAYNIRTYAQPLGTVVFVR